jgi:hypothetical protein
MMPRRLPDDSTLTTLLKTYRICEIARWYRVDRTAVRDHARRLGFPPAPRGGATRCVQYRAIILSVAIPR